MQPHEFPTDIEWQQLANGVATSVERVQQALAAVAERGYLDGRREALEAAECERENAEEALRLREETISDPNWGTW